jgi:ABC-type transporter Mla MlaB component
MAFSLFGKKPPPQPRRQVQSKPKPPPAVEPEVPAQPEPAAEPLPDLEFAPSEHVSAGRQAADSIELREESRVDPVVEEAAILYANGNDHGALAALESAVNRDDLGPAADQVWSLLFELYQKLGMRSAFDERSLDYVVRFEKSPPAWNASEANAVGMSAGGAPLCNLSGALSGASAKQFEQMRRILSKNPLVRLDVAKVTGADAEGCTELLQFLQAAKKLKRTVVVQNASRLASLIQEKVSVGTRENQSIWLVMLELLQQQGEQESFDEWALNYAITFEVSPPSWEPPVVQLATAAAKPAPIAPTATDADDRLVLAGEMAGACTPLLVALDAYANRNDPVIVDLMEVRRMDFVAAASLLNTLSSLAGRGKTIKLTNASGMVTALLNVVGVNQVAEVGRRRG